MSIIIRISDSEDLKYTEIISKWYRMSSEERGTGIAVRSPEYISVRMQNGNGIIALDKIHVIGFCYIEVFQDKAYVSNSGLIIKDEYRGLGLSKKIKKAAFDLARVKFPNAKIFGITTSEIVMKINSNLGYVPVPLHKLTNDDAFWKGCNSCQNYDILLRNKKKMCLCTGMLCDPSKNNQSTKKKLTKCQKID